MKRIALLLAFAVTLSGAQTPTKPITKAPTAKPAVAAKAVTATKPGTATKSAIGARATTGTGVKLPPGITPVAGPLKSAFALRYQEIKIGTGLVAEPLKLYKVAYTGWLAADGKKFDSSLDHPDAQPIQFPQGRGRVIPGWDQGFEGMKIGGKRRLFIPYQLAYGAAGRPPIIPAKSDLIFDVELVEVAEMPAPQGPPTAPVAHPMQGMPATPKAATPPAAAAPAAPTAAPAPAPPPAEKPSNPAQPQ